MSSKLKIFSYFSQKYLQWIFNQWICFWKFKWLHRHQNKVCMLFNLWVQGGNTIKWIVCEDICYIKIVLLEFCVPLPAPAPVTDWLRPRAELPSPGDPPTPGPGLGAVNCQPQQLGHLSVAFYYFLTMRQKIASLPFCFKELKHSYKFIIANFPFCLKTTRETNLKLITFIYFILKHYLVSIRHMA